jgi:hypothetical protein
VRAKQLAKNNTDKVWNMRPLFFGPHIFSGRPSVLNGLAVFSGAFSWQKAAKTAKKQFS